MAESFGDFGDSVAEVEGVGGQEMPDLMGSYRARYAAVIVDEAQDLTPLQYVMLHELGRGRTIFGGDQAQGCSGSAWNSAATRPEHGCKPDATGSSHNRPPGLMEASNSRRMRCYRGTEEVLGRDS
ncbi:UvrD-helicase domain-containing protein [Dactylosporangium sp. NPDC000244]|uniref:UvrD-helicase domain-containing protein n=1 Tax=Dactylosporangium sp. NPDC000244 TaxID=3154365 RepID=UPI00331E12AE